MNHDDNLLIRDNVPEGRYEAVIGAQIVGRVEYRRLGSRIVIQHTVVEPRLRGSEIGTRLVMGMLDDLSARGQTVTSYCGFVTNFLATHPRYQSLIDVTHPGPLTPHTVSGAQSGNDPSYRPTDGTSSVGQTVAGLRRRPSGGTAGRRVDLAPKQIRTERLRLRPWEMSDAEAALTIYGDVEVARWLAPAMRGIGDVGDMRKYLSSWISECARCELPQGRWAMVESATDTVVGGIALLPLPPACEDLEIGWQVARSARGRGYGAEAGHAIAHQALEYGGVTELFAVVRPGNIGGIATARRVGMDWVGETGKYYDMTLQVYRLTKPDLDRPEPACVDR